MTKTKKEQWFKFVQYIKAYRTEQNRGALATLRRSLGTFPELDVRAFPFVFPGIEIAELDRFQQKTAFMISALYALYNSGFKEHIDKEERFSNFGESFRLLSQADKKGSKSLEKRFIALINAHEDDLIQYLKHCVSLISSRNIYINWVNFARDVADWGHPQKYVQTNWAKSFYSEEPKKDSENKKTVNK